MTGLARAVFSPVNRMLNPRPHFSPPPANKPTPAATPTTAYEDWKSKRVFSPLNFNNKGVARLNSKGKFSRIKNTKIIETAAKVDAAGQLCIKENGYAYLNVSNKYIEEVWKKLPTKGAFQPLNTRPQSMGAHISIMDENEGFKLKLQKMAEKGQWFNFEVKELRFVTRKEGNQTKRLWMLAVTSPGLEKLRAKYGLDSKLHGHDFHITIGSESLN